MSTREVAIFWDYENCPSPAGWSGCHLVKRIRCLLQPFGPIKLFKAYLSISEQSQLTRNTLLRSELQASGVSLTDTPHNSRKDVADKMMIVDMLTHAMDNPAPATIVLISGDRDFAYAISVLRLRQYDVVLVTLSNAHLSLTSQASTCFDWAIDVLGTSTETDSSSQIPVKSNGDLDEFKFPALKFVPASTSPKKSYDTLPRSSPSPSPRKKQANGLPFHTKLQESFDQDSTSQGSPRAFPGFMGLPRTSLSAVNIDLGPTSPNSSDVFRRFNDKRFSQEEFDPFQLAGPRGFPEPSSRPSSRFSSSPERPTLSRDPASHGQERGFLQISPTPKGPIPITIEPPKSPPGSWISTTISESESSSYASAPEDHFSRPMRSIFVPSHFKPLIRSLQSYHDRGKPRPFPPSVGAEILMADKTLYDALHNINNFTDYALYAHKAGIVDMGGEGRDAWISLQPDYLNISLV